MTALRNGTLRVGVPPGVGDVYWVLTKLKAYRELHAAKRVTLCIQATSLDRSRAWAEMVDFVDAAQTARFKPPASPAGVGSAPFVDAILWPNTVVDRGEPLANWLPNLPLDLSFPVKTDASLGDDARIVVYASSDAINKAWLPSIGANFWPTLIAAMSKMFVGRVTLIGAHWDTAYYNRVLAPLAHLNIEPLLAATTLPQVADIIKKAKVIVGAISGMTILANHFRTPCIALCPDAHHPKFPYAWVAPDAPYRALRNSAMPPAEQVAQLAKEIAR